MKILIITEFFPPLNNIASGRPLSWAKYLSGKYDVTVVTVKKEEIDGSLDYVDNAQNYKLIEIERPCKGALNVINKFGWILKAFLKLRKEKWDVILSTSNPWQVHLFGNLMKRSNSKICWLTDYRDLWSKNFHTTAKVGIRHSIHTFLEKMIIKKADVITTVSKPLANEILQMFPNKSIEVLFNGFEGEIKKPLKKSKDKLIMVHSGTIYEGKRDPTPVFKAVKELLDEKKISDNQVEIRFLGNRLGNLKQIVRKENSEGFVKLLGQVSRERSIQEQQKANFLLLLESDNQETKGVLTGKLFEYLASGTPIISVGPLADFSSSKVIEKTQTGVACESNIKLIKKLILQEINNKVEYLPVLGEIIKYSRIEQAKKIEHIIQNFV